MLIVIFFYLNLCVIQEVREDIFEKCIFYKKENNGIKHVVNEFIKLKELIDKLINELNKLDKKIDSKNYQKKRKKRKKIIRK